MVRSKITRFFHASMMVRGPFDPSKTRVKNGPNQPFTRLLQQARNRVMEQSALTSPWSRLTP